MDETALHDKERLNLAIITATRYHADQFRKGTNRPYILHPLEVLCILNTMQADTNLLIAGVLHDTIEDTCAKEESVRKEFGDDVVNLVLANSEDKSKTWLERKTHTIAELAKADKRVQMLVLADKTSNLRSIASDYRELEDALWKRFNAPPESQAWYYGGVLNALATLGNDRHCQKIYNEALALYNEVFAKYRKA